ncbi:MAG: response regulator transcription factor [Actinomycetota bacterium]|nr:response regulator transcription factor [Actinomycetota bacterium]
MGERGARVLIIEDEDRLRGALAAGLRGEGYEVAVAADGLRGFELARTRELNVIICDILLPSMSGFRICARLREEGIVTPILMLTAKEGEWDQAEALDAGADGYLTKPVSFVVLSAHVRALARRASYLASSAPGIVRSDGLVVDFPRGRCARDGVEIKLSRRELVLLGALLRRKGATCAKRELLAEVWGEDFDGDENIVEVYIGYLRRKVDLPFARRSIQTVRGEGYRFVGDEPT